MLTRTRKNHFLLHVLKYLLLNKPDIVPSSKEEGAQSYLHQAKQRRENLQMRGDTEKWRKQQKGKMKATEFWMVLKDCHYKPQPSLLLDFCLCKVINSLFFYTTFS